MPLYRRMAWWFYPRLLTQTKHEEKIIVFGGCSIWILGAIFERMFMCVRVGGGGGGDHGEEEREVEREVRGVLLARGFLLRGLRPGRETDGCRVHAELCSFDPSYSR